MTAKTNAQEWLKNNEKKNLRVLGLEAVGHIRNLIAQIGSLEREIDNREIVDSDRNSTPWPNPERE